MIWSWRRRLESMVMGKEKMMEMKEVGDVEVVRVGLATGHGVTGDAVKGCGGVGSWRRKRER